MKEVKEKLRRIKQKQKAAEKKLEKNEVDSNKKDTKKAGPESKANCKKEESSFF